MSDIALQLYSLRREFAADPEAALRRVPELGFRTIETAGTYEWSAGRWNALLSELGLSVVSAHVGIEALEKDFGETVLFYRTIGCPALIVPYLPMEAFQLEVLPETAARLGTLAKRLGDEGFAFAYHNHAHEITPLPTGEIPLEALARQLGDHKVGFQVDTYWVEKAGKSSLGFIRHMAPRITHIHAKEYRKSDGLDVPAGTGDVPFREILGLARERAWPIVLEFEGEDAPVAVATGGAYLRSLA